MEIYNGEENGWKYRVYLDASQWVAEVTSPTGDTKEERWHWHFEPKAGADVADMETARHKLIKMLPAEKV